MYNHMLPMILYRNAHLDFTHQFFLVTVLVDVGK
jgi:hypothetical protein